MVKNQKSQAYQSLRDSAPQVYDDIIKQFFIPLADKGEYFSTIVELALGTYQTKAEVWSELSTDEGYIGGKLKVARANLFSSHQNKLMKVSQTKRRDDDLIEQIENTWTKSQLPKALNGFFKKPPENDSRNELVVRAQKLTVDLPLLLAFLNMVMLEGKLPGCTLNYLIFLLSQLQQFDREWLQKSMALAIGAANICLNNSENYNLDNELKNIIQEVEND
jgi:hypothetical protein